MKSNSRGIEPTVESFHNSLSMQHTRSAAPFVAGTLARDGREQAGHGRACDGWESTLDPVA